MYTSSIEISYCPPESAFPSCKASTQLLSIWFKIISKSLKACSCAPMSAKAAARASKTYLSSVARGNEMQDEIAVEMAAI